jgi:hypothetical protein
VSRNHRCSPPPYLNAELSAMTDWSISRSTISGNQTTQLNTYGYGGGIHTLAAQTTITDSTIAGNIATRYGGGLFARKAVTISRSIIRDNVALNGQSGGIHEVGGSLTLTDSLVSGNRANGGSGGGLTINSLVASTISGCTITGNSANGGGGVLLESQTGSAPITFRNCTITGNQAKSIGGGFEISSCNVVLHNCTIAYNLAGVSGSSTGGGIRMTQGSLTLESTIVAMNSAGGGKPDFDTGTTPVTANHCLIGSTAGAVNFTGDAITQQLLGLDPLLAPLANNGGRTPTLALKAGSPCINQGTNPDSLRTDQRGPPHTRRLGLAVDIGAYERQ